MNGMNGNWQEWTKRIGTDRKIEKRTETDSNGQILTKMDRNRQKELEMTTATD